MKITGRLQRLVNKLPKTNTRQNILIAALLIVFVIALLTRLPFMSSGIDQWDAVLYRNSLVGMRFFREAEWPILLLFQKLLWSIFPGFSPQQILSLTNIILSAATLTLFFAVVYKITRSYISSILLSVLLFFIPLFGVYSVVGMQDMPQTFAVTLFLFAILQFCLAKDTSKGWLYVASFIAGLMLGIRFTMILMLPSLLLAMLLSKGLGLRTYLRSGLAFLSGALIWIIADIFIPSMPHAQPVAFFLNQFKAFNPDVLGYWIKAGDYPLLSGYMLDWYFWLPLFWLAVYLISRRRQKNKSWVPIIALGASLLSLLLANGLSKIIGPRLPNFQIIMAVITIVLLIYELFKNLPKAKHYIVDISPREKALAVISCLILSFLAFNYIFTGPVARYLLPIIPAILVLSLLLANRVGWKSWGIALAILLFGFWARPFNQALAMVKTFKTLDPRSSVSRYVLAHDGRYYDFDPNHSTGSHLITYGAGERVVQGFANGCATALDISQTNYAIFYGPALPDIVSSCPDTEFVEVARYQRDENIIEDSVGNIGFTIYRLVPKE